MSNVYVTRESDGVTLCWDHYALAERGMPSGYREATPAERAAFIRLEELERRIERVESELRALKEKPRD